MSDPIPIKPQPRNGPPFQFDSGHNPAHWFNENVGYRFGRLPMLFRWACPFGENGEPRLIDGVWYWVEKLEADASK